MKIKDYRPKKINSCDFFLQAENDMSIDELMAKYGNMPATPMDVDGETDPGKFLIHLFIYFFNEKYSRMTLYRFWRGENHSCSNLVCDVIEAFVWE